MQNWTNKKIFPALIVIKDATDGRLTYGKFPTVINMALSTADSSMKGVVINHFAELERTLPEPDKADIRKATGLNLILENKATWNNTNYGRPFEAFQNKGGFTGSRVRTLMGGASDDTAGAILQNDTNPITAEKLTGHINVLYAHTNQGSMDPYYW